VEEWAVERTRGWKFRARVVRTKAVSRYACQPHSKITMDGRKPLLEQIPQYHRDVSRSFLGGLQAKPDPCSRLGSKRAFDLG
jgi:hypothetical protein